MEGRRRGEETTSTKSGRISCGDVPDFALETPGEGGEGGALFVCALTCELCARQALPAPFQLPWKYEYLVPVIRSTHPGSYA